MHYNGSHTTSSNLVATARDIRILAIHCCAPAITLQESVLFPSCYKTRYTPSRTLATSFLKRIPLVLDQHSSSTSSSDESMNYDDHDNATATFSLPAAATPDVTEALAQLQASIDQIRARDGDAKLKDILLMHLHGIEQRLTTRLDDQDRVLGALLDVRRVKELEAKVIYLDEQVAATRNALLEFSAQAQQTLNIITDQLSELVAYINRGGNDKKGEVVSRSRPKPPPDDQNRDNGNAVGGGDTDRSIVERILSADRQRQRERRIR
ncbi:myosin-2 heavy chain-like [Dorcoceras hygrometricum]|uniref:Myosin-2 heavy chain-like n=1 Tax=Dorcoceras hygrometricum TaxID=472368 RepID=A0A2Z7A4U7_9LAMI|nr:myosin-2 heavy chain-like [Dorcoceras hygrometricum]